MKLEGTLRRHVTLLVPAALGVACSAAPLSNDDARVDVGVVTEALSNGSVVGLGGKCLDAKGGALVIGTPIILWDCNGQEWQKWRLTSDGHLQTQRDFCLTIANDSTENGAKVVVGLCSDNRAARLWRTDSAGRIRGFNGKCIDVEGGSSASGTAIIMWDCHDGENQRWSLSAAAPGAPDACLKSSYDRPAGTPPTTCDAGRTFEDGLCYQTCPVGFEGRATRCIAPCPPGFVTEPETCRSGGTILGRPSFDRSVGTLPHCSDVQSEQGGLCYARCLNGYEPVATGCTSTCPASQPFQCGLFCGVTQAKCDAAALAAVASSVSGNGLSGESCALP